MVVTRRPRATSNPPNRSLQSILILSHESLLADNYEFGTLASSAAEYEHLCPNEYSTPINRLSHAYLLMLVSSLFPPLSGTNNITIIGSRVIGIHFPALSMATPA